VDRVESSVQKVEVSNRSHFYKINFDHLLLRRTFHSPVKVVFAAGASTDPAIFSSEKLGLTLSNTQNKENISCLGASPP